MEKLDFDFQDRKFNKDGSVKVSKREIAYCKRDAEIAKRAGEFIADKFVEYDIYFAPTVASCAMQMYLKYLGNKPITGEKEYELFEDVGFHYPFQVEGIGDPIMRTPFKFNKEENALMCDYDMPEGTKFRFSMPPEYDIVENI